MIFEKFLMERFGIKLGPEYVFSTGKNKVYICNRNLFEIEIKGMQRKGMLAGKLESIYGIKPSLDFVLLFGHLATKNYVVFDDTRIKQLYMGKSVDCSESVDDGLVIVKGSDGRGKAVCMKRGNMLISLVPKDRQVNSSQISYKV